METASHAPDPKPNGSPDEIWMDRALEEAGKSFGLTSPNPPVGAVLVHAGKIIGTGYHHQAGRPHAEVEAVRDAETRGNGALLSDSTLYVTLEPCSTHGRTPPCTDLILEKRIPRVVVGATDPFPGHQGGGLWRLEANGVSVTTGVRDAECRHLIRFFTKRVTEGRPWVTAKSAITLNGCTTLPPGEDRWLSNETSRADVHRLRSRLDGILIGGQTLRADDPQLTVRGEWADYRPEQPWRIVVSRSGDLPDAAQVFTDAHQDRTLVFTTEDLGSVLRELAARGLNSVMLESGGHLFATALQQGLVDEVVLYVAPILAGGGQRLLDLPDFMTRLRDVETHRFGDDVRITGIIDQPTGIKPIISTP